MTTPRDHAPGDAATSAPAEPFGVKNLGMNQGWIFTAYGVAGILGPVVAGALFDATGD